eukprot:1842847-Pleurochrysis_carterae.AAC.2
MRAPTSSASPPTAPPSPPDEAEGLPTTECDGEPPLPTNLADSTANVDGAGDAEPERPVKRRLLVKVNVRALVHDLGEQVTDLRSQLLAAWRSRSEVTKHRDQLLTDARRGQQKSNGAELVVQQAVEWRRQSEVNASAKRKLSGEISYRFALEKELREERELREKAESKRGEAEHAEAKAVAEMRNADAVKKRLEHAQAEVAASAQRSAAHATEIKSLKKQVAALERELTSTKEDLSLATTQLDDTTTRLEEKIDELTRQLKTQSSQHASLKELHRNRGGRPRGHAGKESLEQRWEEMKPTARRAAMMRHARDIEGALRAAGVEDWSPSCFALALKSLNVLDSLFRTKAFASRQFDLAEHLAAVLKAEWGVRLALFLRSELKLTETDYSKLRLSFCKRYDQGKDHWTKRLWYSCPVLNKRIYLPEPLLSKYKWLPVWTEYCKGVGLQVSEDGKVCERGLLRTARTLIDRDAHQLTDPAKSNWLLTFGIDGTAASSKRVFTHALLSIAAMYQHRRPVLSEMKAATIAIGLHKDDSSGLPSMMHNKSVHAGKDGLEVTCLAEEIELLHRERRLKLLDGRVVPCDVRCCLDLAAVRGMRGCRGKAAALCGCRGKEGRQSLPGEDGIPAIPDGESLSTWAAARQILATHCSFGSSLMSSASLRDAAHVPPSSWDPGAGAWHCRHCNRDVYSSWEEYKADKAALQALKAAKADGDKTAGKEVDKIMGEHAASHLDQLKFVPPVLDTGTDIFIVDSLHALQLNAGKVAWKYSFVDKLTDPTREKATEYMESIGCYLDLRAKGQRDPQQKFMSGSTVDDYVLGKLRDRTSKSPGLAVNTLALCEIVYGGKASDQEAAAAASTQAPHVAQPARPPSQSRRRRANPVVGFEAGSAAEAPAAAAVQDDELKELLELDEGDGSTDSAAIRTYLHSRYGNKAANVLSVLKLWEAYGKVYMAWCDPWTDEDNQEYRAKRALRFLRAGECLSPLT